MSKQTQDKVGEFKIWGSQSKIQATLHILPKIARGPYILASNLSNMTYNSHHLGEQKNDDTIELTGKGWKPIQFEIETLEHIGPSKHRTYSAPYHSADK